MRNDSNTAPNDVSFYHYFVILFQFGLFLVVVDKFRIESIAFFNLGILSMAGWAVHYFLPQRHRLLFFVVLSLLGIELVFGLQQGELSPDGLLQGLWIIALGLGLIGICHLPLSFAARIALLAATGGTLAIARVGLVDVPWSAAVWPILGSMFMFRLIVYVLQMRHDKKPATVLETLGYFFMLPNVVFPLFPVIDYQTFRRSHYAGTDRHQTYQTGIHWMFRGVFHLIVYRLVYQNFVIETADVANTADLLQYLLWPFMLYLRVSGTFHIITGMMQLFGFKLPETHKLYFLSSSFTDFWRRINIYWKDFIMKVFFYPVYYKLRRYGETGALVGATFLAFAMTWVLHGYQWFWLRGTWLLSWNDGLFWAILAALVVANSLYEIRFGRRRRLSGKVLSWRDTVPTALRTIGVFATISILWSFWTAGSVSAWLMAWGALGKSGGLFKEVLIVAAVVVAVGAPSILLARGLADRKFNFTRSAVTVIGTAVILISVLVDDIYWRVGAQARWVISTARNRSLNTRDLAKLERGYYENLMEVGGFNVELMQVYSGRPASWRSLGSRGVLFATGTIPGNELKPFVDVDFKGANVKSNRWGMRDDDYEKTPPENTLRIALLGSSFLFGSGVEKSETLDAVLENRLNREGAGGRYARYELLNFGQSGYTPIDSMGTFDRKVVEFKPDYVFYFEHHRAGYQTVERLATLLQAPLRHDYEFLHDVCRQAGIDENRIHAASEFEIITGKLRPFEEDLLRGIYTQIIATARKHDIKPVWIFFPRPIEKYHSSPPEMALRLAREAGFIILDLSRAYSDHELDTLWIASWDWHPNALGNRLIADKLYSVLRAAEDEIPLGLPKTKVSAVSGDKAALSQEEKNE